MRAMIDARYPGTRLAITEYNWGGDTGISSALAQAEALAIFGREGVDLATRWVAPAPGTRVEDAFRLYLDYDGAGSPVSGDSVRAASANVDDVGAYAVAGAGTRLFLLLFNKATSARDAAVALPDALHWRARLWRFDAASALGPAGRRCRPAARSPSRCRRARPRSRRPLLDFDDVPVTHPFYDFVMKTADDGVSAGCGGDGLLPGRARHAARRWRCFC